MRSGILLRGEELDVDFLRVIEVLFNLCERSEGVRVLVWRGGGVPRKKHRMYH